MDTIYNKIAELDKLDSGIIRITYTGYIADLNEIKAFVELLKNAYFKGEPLLIMSNLQKTKKVSKDVRSYLASDEIAHLIKASAIIVNSALPKIIGNIFLQFNKPKYETKIFSNEATAGKWLLAQ